MFLVLFIAEFVVFVTVSKPVAAVAKLTGEADTCRLISGTIAVRFVTIDFKLLLRVLNGSFSLLIASANFSTCFIFSSEKREVNLPTSSAFSFEKELIERESVARTHERE